MKKKLASTWKIYIRYWPVQLNGKKFATGPILKKPVELVKGRILAGWAQKSPEPCSKPSETQLVSHLFHAKFKFIIIIIILDTLLRITHFSF